MAKKEKKKIINDEIIELNIPEEEIWTYKVPGLAAPHINKPHKYYEFKIAAFILVIIIRCHIVYACNTN